MQRLQKEEFQSDGTTAKCPPLIEHEAAQGLKRVHVSVSYCQNKNWRNNKVCAHFLVPFSFLDNKILNNNKHFVRITSELPGCDKS